MSYWKSATLAAKMAVVEPISLIEGSAHVVFWRIGKLRIKRNTPATTMVELWRRAETGVGPSIAEGSHGWSINWADLPTAAIISPRAAALIIQDEVDVFMKSSSSRSQEFKKIIERLINKIIPLSPIRLYIMACSAALLASLRVNHQPINTKDKMPTPSQPMKSKNSLLEDTNISIRSKKSRREFINFPLEGSEAI